MQVGPAVSSDGQGIVFASAFGGLIILFDARKYEQVCCGVN